jgi:hypothetical protein
MSDKDAWGTPAPNSGSSFNLQQDLDRLRGDYVNATPKQRLKVIVDRLRDPNIGPNLVVTGVSAVEAFARCAVVERKVASGEGSKSEIYPRYRDARPEQLVGMYLQIISAGRPKDIFGDRAWDAFLQAVAYRDLLVHECTYLRMEKLHEINTAVSAVLERLVELEGLTEKYHELLAEYPAP